MRLFTWLCLLALGASLTAAGGAPAAAGNLVARSRSMTLAGHVHSPFERHRFFLGGLGFGPFAFGSSVVAPGEYLGGMMPPIIVLDRAQDQAPASPPPLEHPSVETTPEGVVIVRGPGSRHLHF